MHINSRPLALSPYEGLDVPTFTLSSRTLTDGAPMPESATARAGSLSPDLTWEGFPTHTASFMVTCFDPDAPTPAGWWHWTVLDIPASMTHLDAGAGASDLTLDGPAFHLRVDTGDAAYFGAAPPPGDRPHRYVFTVHALDVDTLGLDDDATPTMASFVALEHTIARACLTVTHQA
ncbi:YbhB/YbcL family Raf kinase inhibitor-like protein [Schaalia odontolytica]|uniref:YbhB/YbcL family Raf kinase inhibitor-like protein n=1 Tax=Schaalia odontolytica TaxID=1660 RepID=UPI00211C5230|nr:YbhB/YbcL family Raf kinase inhibitor-like protein [Schaalia odontolytica]UUO94082.1 YbhB/YbcL family Raf kinase inhibitor-like protein [Schaalia odontolytica]